MTKCKLKQGDFCMNRGRQFKLYNGKIPKKVCKEGILTKDDICKNCLEKV